MAKSTGTIPIGTLRLELQLTTDTGGPITLGQADIDMTGRLESTRDGATITVDHDIIKHEIAAALIDAARQLDT